MKQYYKGAMPSGWDFYTGKTVNYRESIGKLVKVVAYDEEPHLCSSSVLHASKDPQDVFTGCNIPLSLFIVEGIPVIEDKSKAGFKEFKVVEEVPEVQFSNLFGFDYEEVLHPLDPRTVTVSRKISSETFKELEEWVSVRASVRASVRDSVKASVWASVWDSVRDSVKASVRASVWDSVRDSIWDSIWDSEASYIGHLFKRSVKKWKYTEQVKVEGYPFQSGVNLLRKGLVPMTDGKDTWYFRHPVADKPAELVWKGRVK